MTFRLIVKGNEEQAIKACTERLPEESVVRVVKTNEFDTILNVTSSADSIEKVLRNWFAEDYPYPITPKEGFPPGSLLWHSTS